MTRPDEAWQLLEPLLRPLPAERLPRRLAAGRVLAEEIRATVDVPPADVSAMDGYAVVGDGAGQRLPVSGTVAAGDPDGGRCVPGTAVRIMTGATVPSGADRVVPVELTDGGAEEVVVHDRPAAGAHIRRRAEIVAAGDPMLPKGTALTPGALALLATHGVAELVVHRAPAVRLLVTGDEVVPPDSQPGPGQLRDSHTDFLLAAVRAAGLELFPLGIAPDERGTLAARIADGLEADVLLLTGGVSMGDYDHVEGILAELGCETVFDSVAMQPGKPLVAARHAGGLVFGLPGNPGSVMTSFWLFVRPALRRLMGYRDGFWHGALDGTLAGPLPGAKGRDRFLPAEVEVADGAAQVRPIASRGSHDLMATAGGNALVRVPTGAAPTEPGEPCRFLLLPG